MAPGGQAPPCSAPGHRGQVVSPQSRAAPGQPRGFTEPKPGKQGLPGQGDPVLHRKWRENTSGEPHLGVSVSEWRLQERAGFHRYFSVLGLETAMDGS